jgi:hypothetical protein
MENLGGAEPVFQGVDGHGFVTKTGRFLSGSGQPLQLLGLPENSARKNRKKDNLADFQCAASKILHCLVHSLSRLPFRLLKAWMVGQKSRPLVGSLQAANIRISRPKTMHVKLRPIESMAWHTAARPAEQYSVIAS